MNMSEEREPVIGVIASMKRGLEHFIYREISLLEAQGLSISIFPTKYGPGLYNAREGWELHTWNSLAVFALQPYFFLRAPLLYLRLLREALATGAVMDFALAWYFAP